jgi:hypothetical protein
VPRGLYLSDEALRNPGWFRTNPIYFWDKSHSVLVPDVRYLPLSTEPNLRPTMIVNYLLAGPSSMVQKAVEALPDKAKRVGNVVSEEDGLVVGLTPGSVSDEQNANRLIAQLRASLGGQKVILEVDKVRRTATGKDDDYRAYHATLQGTRVAFGVSTAEESRGKVIVLGQGDATPSVLGPKSQANRNVISAAINRELDRAAFVRQVNGRLQLWLASSDAQSTTVTQRQVPLPTIATMSRPAWVYGTAYALVAVNGNLYSVRQSGQVLPTTPVGAEGKVTQVATSPEGRRVAFVADGAVYVSTVDADRGSVNATSTEIGLLPLDRVLDVGWTAEDRLVVFGLSGQTVRAYRVSSDGVSATAVANLEDATLTGLAEIAAFPGDAWEDFYVVARTDRGVFEVNRTGSVVRAQGKVSLEFFPG